MSNLVKHADRELKLLGYTNEPINREDINTWMYHGIMTIVKKFSEEGHSGASSAYAVELIGKLLRYQNLSPLTNDPAEWIDVSDGMWQSNRRPDAFSNDGGKTYYLLDETRWVWRKLFYAIPFRFKGLRKIARRWMHPVHTSEAKS